MVWQYGREYRRCTALIQFYLEEWRKYKSQAITTTNNYILAYGLPKKYFFKINVTQKATK